MSDRIEALLKATARRAGDEALAGFPARVRVVYESRRRGISLRDLGFALAGAAAAAALLLAIPRGGRAPMAEELQLTAAAVEAVAAEMIPALNDATEPDVNGDSLEGLDTNDLAAFEALLDEKLAG